MRNLPTVNQVFVLHLFIALLAASLAADVVVPWFLPYTSVGIDAIRVFVTVVIAIPVLLILERRRPSREG